MNIKNIQSLIASWQVDQIEELFSSIKDPSLVIYLRSNLVSTLEKDPSRMLKEIEEQSFNIVGDFLDCSKIKIRRDVEIDGPSLSKEIFEIMKERFLPRQYRIAS